MMKSTIVQYAVEVGEAFPLGATVQTGGVNFSLFAEHATSATLCLFTDERAEQPFQTISLERTNAFWHAFVRELPVGTLYGYRVDGPNRPEEGLRYNAAKLLIDPYAKGNSTVLWNRTAATTADDNTREAMRSVVIDVADYDWEGDKPLNRPLDETIIYELHVRGFTMKANVAERGTFRGLIEKIPYLQQLGITAIELLPVFEFDDTAPLRVVDGQPLYNYWGYSTIGYMAPNSEFCVAPQLAQQVTEFRDMVKAMHKAGIEVILDVVFNHTDEGNENGPTMSFRGLDNLVYYYLMQDRRYYENYSGCGNTFNANHPVVTKLILDSLHFWVEEMHVDGFRFDEGSILSRGEDGQPMAHPPVLWGIELSERLATTKLLTEAWDAGNLYQVGSFPGFRWVEWNGKYRDTMRSFIRGDAGMINDVATRLAGSSDLYNHDLHSPLNSLNFITCHDGFTLMDLVSYEMKHNEANGENNRDGIDHNISANYGVEGPTMDGTLRDFRFRQLRNFFSLLFVSQGVPMIVAGDEFGRTQRGNNNAYCQDNDVSWIDWALAEDNQPLVEFTTRLIQLRKTQTNLRRRSFFTGAVNDRSFADVSWHGCQLFSPGWNNPASRVLAVTLGSFVDGEADLHIIFNMDPQPLTFEVPAAPKGFMWSVYSDTSLQYEIGQRIADDVEVSYFTTIILQLVKER